MIFEVLASTRRDGMEDSLGPGGDVVLVSGSGLREYGVVGLVGARGGIGGFD